MVCGCGADGVRSTLGWRACILDAWVYLEGCDGIHVAENLREIFRHRSDSVLSKVQVGQLCDVANQVWGDGHGSAAEQTGEEVRHTAALILSSQLLELSWVEEHGTTAGALLDLHALEDDGVHVRAALAALVEV